MKVKELIEQLLEADPEMEVFCQADAEGNGFRPCAGADPDGLIWNSSRYDWESICPEDYEDLDEEDQENYKKSVIIWPV